MKRLLLISVMMMLCVVVSGQGKTCSLTHGELVTDHEAELSPNGSLITIAKKGSPFDGCVLEIPPRALTASQTVTFRFAKGVFKDAQGGSHEVMVLAITPFAHTTSGNGYADEMVAFKIPVDSQNPAMMLMACAFNMKNNRPDMIMVAPSPDGKFMVMATRHFNDPFFFLGLQ
jgi:hypothetical protein